jgi:hypothetical protein
MQVKVTNEIDGDMKLVNSTVVIIMINNGNVTTENRIIVVIGDRGTNGIDIIIEIVTDIPREDIIVMIMDF